MEFIPNNQPVERENVTVRMRLRQDGLFAKKSDAERRRASAEKESEVNYFITVGNIKRKCAWRMEFVSVGQ